MSQNVNFYDLTTILIFLFYILWLEHVLTEGGILCFVNKK